MLFNTFDFLWMFPLIFLAYYACLGCNRIKASHLGNAFLILISYGLYIKWKPVYALVLLWVTLVTFVAAKQIETCRKYRLGGAKLQFVLALLLTFAPLFFFKYYNFVNDSLSDALGFVGISTGLPGLNWVMPLGLSFFTLQAVGYLADVYQGKIAAERNWWYYMLFVSFFPQIASGPISKAADLLPQIKIERQFDYAQCVEGLRWLLWGMFMKVVLADRVGLLVNTIYDNYIHQGGFSLLIGSILYTFQIYGDFAGYSFMAVGVGKLMGFNLINNFNRPYLSQSVTEFWHRWHISLSTWLKDYVYITMGGSRCSKARNYWNIFVTFFVSGIWHGANWTFLVWGSLHGLFQIVEKMLGLHKKTSHGIVRLTRIVVTFLLVNFAWIFFRMPTLTDAVNVVAKIFTDWSMGLPTVMPSMLLMILLSLIVVMIKDVTDEVLPHHYQLLTHYRVMVRWSVYVLLAVIILCCGVFDASQFIYVSF